LKKYSTEVIPLIENFCVWLQEQKKSENTIKTYKRELEKYQEWLQEKGTGLDLLKKVDIQPKSQTSITFDWSFFIKVVELFYDRW
jgi:integrase/recombinase XerD